MPPRRPFFLILFRTSLCMACAVFLAGCAASAPEPSYLDSLILQPFSYYEDYEDCDDLESGDIFGDSFSESESDCVSLPDEYDDYQQEGIASWYGRKFHGKKTASGERYNMYSMTAAHKTLPLHSTVRVTHIKNGRSILVRINDRGPFSDSRIIDLSYAAAKELGIVNTGLGRVRVETESIAGGAEEADAAPRKETAGASGEKKH